MAEQNNFFNNYQKGEIGLLKKEFRGVKTQQATRDLVKRIIAHMTMGIDVSPLLPEMILALNTTDLVVKKLVYLYLSRYAAVEKDTALLVVNSLRNDCMDDNPMIRGLALRAMSSLGMKSIVEYLIPLLKNALKDLNPYVRKTGVLALLKLYHLSPESVRGAGMLNKLYMMVSDKDSLVSANCIYVLNEMLAAEGGMAVNKPLMHHLLNRIKEFDEWGVAVIFDVLARYVPQDEDELFDIFNILDEKLKVLNSAVVLAAARVFLKFSEQVDGLKEQIYERLKDPLLTLGVGACPEVSFAILKHLLVMTQNMPPVFEGDAHYFFVHYNDPLYIKQLKVEILTLIASPRNVESIINELSVYVSDVGQKFAVLAIQSIAKIGCVVPDYHVSVTQTLLKFLDLDIDYVTTATVTVMKDLLRIFPDQAAEVVPCMKRVIATVDSDEGKEALIWMIGEYGEHIWESPYILEEMVDAWDVERSPAVRLALLTTVMRLFFKRAPECRDLILKLLQAALSDTENQDVHDRALFYYRLLSANLEEANRIVNGERVPFVTGAADLDTVLRDSILEEFNSCAVVFGKPARSFVRRVPQPFIRSTEKGRGGKAEEHSVSRPEPALEHEESDEDDDEEDDRAERDAPFTAGAERAAAAATLDLLSADLVDLGISPAVALSLNYPPNPSLTPRQFQAKWMETTVTVPVATFLSHSVEASARAVEEMLASRSFAHIASGNVGNSLKFYFYAQESSGKYGFYEILIDLATRAVSAKVRAETEELAKNFASELARAF